MLDEFDKIFSLLAILISFQKYGEVFFVFESLEIIYTPPITKDESIRFKSCL
jgi:hypothetical protein